MRGSARRLAEAKTVGQRCAFARQLAGLSDGQAAKALGRVFGPFPTLGRDLRAAEEEREGFPKIDEHVLVSMAKLYAVSIHWLRTGETQPVMLPPTKAMPDDEKADLMAMLSVLAPSGVPIPKRRT